MCGSRGKIGERLGLYHWVSEGSRPGFRHWVVPNLLKLCDRSRQDWNGFFVPAPEAGQVELFGTVGAAENRFGENAAGGQYHRVSIRNVHVIVGEVLVEKCLRFLFLADGEIPTESHKIAGNGDRIWIHRLQQRGTTILLCTD